MKYIARCVEKSDYSCGNREFCSHAKPHNWITEGHNIDGNCYNNHGTECDCFPVSIEYYMKEIIKKHEEGKE